MAIITLGTQSGQDKQVIVAWQMICLEEAVAHFLGGNFFVLHCKDVIDQFCPSWIPRWWQG
jgi:hypothetical protein